MPHGFVWLRVPLMALPPPPVRSLASATLNSHLTNVDSFNQIWSELGYKVYTFLGLSTIHTQPSFRQRIPLQQSDRTQKEVLTNN